MKRITALSALPLHDASATRRIEAAAAASRAPHALMARAGDAVARLAVALAPHARTIWLACGPGNNGGDGLEAAALLAQRGKTPVVTWLGDAEQAPADSREALHRARAAGVSFLDAPPPRWDLGIDALLGIGAGRSPEGVMADWVARLNASTAPVLAVDLPTGLNGDTGAGGAVRATHTLSLLTLKPGLFTGVGRDFAGEVWHEDLGAAEEAAAEAPTAWHSGAPPVQVRRHASHKGSYGDVAVIGGDTGMEGAALLAARAALQSGAGRVYAALLGAPAHAWDTARPDLMLRDWQTLSLHDLSVACGCGGGEAVRAVLPAVLSRTPRLVLDADALNAIASDTALQTLLRQRAGRREWQTVLTPHPLEAARLCAMTTAQVQAARIDAAHALAQRLGCVVLLKGSGSVVADGTGPARINPTGNGRLATAGTGDVLAGMVAARLAHGETAMDAAAHAAWQHGRLADTWPAGPALNASALADRIG